MPGALDTLPPRMTLDELVGRAINSNYELQHLAQETKVEQSRESLLRAERMPNLGVQVGTDFNAPGDFRVGPRGQISIDLPIFMRNQGEIAQSSATLRALESETAATRRSVAGQVGTAFYDLDARLTEAEIFPQDAAAGGGAAGQHGGRKLPRGQGEHFDGAERAPGCAAGSRGIFE